MAKSLKSKNEKKDPSTTIAAFEKLFGPVLPGQSSADKTISVFEEYAPNRKRKLYGLAGVLSGAIWHLHTQVPIDPAKIKGRVTGIVEGGKQHDPNRRQLAAAWLSQFEAATADAKRESDRLAEIERKMVDRAGEYDAQLVIESIHETIKVRISVDIKGAVTLLLPKRKKLQMPPIV